jgi:hypothetical protein
VLEARLALEKFKAPRPLSREQIESIARKLPSLEMNSVAIGVNPATLETVALAEQIAAILSLAEFSPNINNGFTTNTLGVFKGVIVAHVTGNDESSALANALIAGLKDAGIDARGCRRFARVGVYHPLC